MTDYKKHLKMALVGDGKIITYRQLSRELKVNVNVAKEMLYDFHRDLNLRKPNSCHATYILSGLRSISSSDAGGKGDDGNGSGNGGADTGVDKDVYMHSSPFELSSQPTPMEGVEAGFGDARKGAGMVRSIVLVPEERLDETKASFQVLSSIHVYCIEPTPLNDMMILAANTLEVTKIDLVEASPQDLSRKYGSIMCAGAKRRTGPRFGTLPAAPPAAAAAASASTTKGPTDEKKPVPPQKATPASATTTQGKRAHADFFKSFGGGAKKKDQPKTEPPTTTTVPSASSVPAKGTGSLSTTAKPPKPPSPSTQKPTKPADPNKMDIDFGPPSDDDDDDDEPGNRKRVPEEAVEDAEKSSSTAVHAQLRRDRDAALRAMMDDSDDDKPEPLTSTPPSAQKQPSPTFPSAQKQPSPSQAQPQPQPPQPHPKRRRARRKVIKRFTTRDQDGYLVTSNEPVWESYSEDEPENHRPAPPTFTSTAGKQKVAAAAQKEREKEKEGTGKKESGGGGGKKGKGAGQGNIMNFFGKR